MPLLAKVGSFQASTAVATTVVQVRGVGFQPKVVLFFWCGRDGAADASGEADVRGGFGWMIDGSNRHCITVSSDHAATVGECDNTKRNDACIATIAVGTGDPQALEGRWDFSAWDADGFDLIVDDAFATAFRVGYLALGGDDLRNVAAGSFTAPGSPGDLDVSAGFRPDCVLIIGEGQNADNNVAVDMRMSLGAAHDALDAQAVSAVFADDSPTTSDTASYHRGGEVLAVLSTATNVLVRGSLSQMNPDGFRINFAEANARSFYWLALGGIQCRVGRLATSTGASGIPVNTGFLPRAILFVSNCRPQDASDTPSAHAAMSIGAATGAAERMAVLFQDKDAIGTMDGFTALEFDEVYINADVAATQAVEGLMDLQSVEADGFTCIMDNADDAANSVMYLAFGDELPPLDRRRAKLWL